MKTKTVKEIEQIIQKIERKDDPVLSELALDSRKGVQRLIDQWRRKKNQQEREKARYHEMQIYENEVRNKGFQRVAGIDEAGRGPLAGPVVAAAVILPENSSLEGINDSKKLNEMKREQLYEQIMREAVAVGIGIVTADEIDQINIFEATKKSMIHAVNDLHITPDYLLIDAVELLTPYAHTSIVKGDEKSVSIAAASIVAKVTRDRMMIDLSKKYPNYRFDLHKGYATKQHMQLLRAYGPCPIHRKSFAPIKATIK